MEQERQRLFLLTQIERNLREKGFLQIAGVDEAGRGPLAGPVVAAACILPSDFFLSGVDDSKKLLPKKRKELFEKIKERKDVFYGIGIADEKKIDEINILQATFLAMQQAIKNLPKIPDYLLIDGNRFVKSFCPVQCVVGGDALSLSIATASILAKETRDALMDVYHEKWPEYGFLSHKGYGTKQHLEALKKYGPCDIHRKTFAPISSFLK